MLQRDHELQTRLRTQAIIPILSSVLQDAKNVHLTIIQRNRHLKNAGEAGSAGGIGPCPSEVYFLPPSPAPPPSETLLSVTTLTGTNFLNSQMLVCSTFAIFPCPETNRKPGPFSSDRRPCIFTLIHNYADNFSLTLQDVSNLESYFYSQKQQLKSCNKPGKYNKRRCLAQARIYDKMHASCIWVSS